MHIICWTIARTDAISSFKGCFFGSLLSFSKKNSLKMKKMPFYVTTTYWKEHPLWSSVSFCSLSFFVFFRVEGGERTGIELRSIVCSMNVTFSLRIVSSLVGVEMALRFEKWFFFFFFESREGSLPFGVRRSWIVGRTLFFVGVAKPVGSRVLGEALVWDGPGADTGLTSFVGESSNFLEFPTFGVLDGDTTFLVLDGV